MDSIDDPLADQDDLIEDSDDLIQDPDDLIEDPDELIDEPADLLDEPPTPLDDAALLSYPPERHFHRSVEAKSASSDITHDISEFYLERLADVDGWNDLARNASSAPNSVPNEVRQLKQHSNNSKPGVAKRLALHQRIARIDDPPSLLDSDTVDDVDSDPAPEASKVASAEDAQRSNTSDRSSDPTCEWEVEVAEGFDFSWLVTAPVKTEREPKSVSPARIQHRDTNLIVPAKTKAAARIRAIPSFQLPRTRTYETGQHQAGRLAREAQKSKKGSATVRFISDANQSPSVRFR